MPLAPEEYRVGLLYMVARATLQESSKSTGEQVCVVKNEPFVENEFGLPPGQYTEKIFYFKRSIPKLFAMMLPESALQVTEYSYNAFPHAYTYYENNYFKNRFQLSVKSRYVADDGSCENVFDLSESELKEREVEVIDVCADSKVKFHVGEDPRKVVSKRAGLGPFVEKYYKTSKNRMCAYKLVKFNLTISKLQARLETWAQQSGFRNKFITCHRKMLCWIDEWWGKTLDEMRMIERDFTETLNVNFGETADSSLSNSMTSQSSGVCAKDAALVAS